MKLEQQGVTSKKTLIQ